MQKIEISEKSQISSFRPAKRFLTFFVEFSFLRKFQSMKINKVYSFSPLYVGNLILKSFSQNEIMRKLSNSNQNTH